MASTSSISGLASGLDTDSIVTSLMQLEAVPQTKLKTTLTTEQTNLKTLQSLNTQIAALTTQAQTLGKAATWGALSATSSSTAVTLSTTSGTASGTFSLTVNQTATASRLAFTNTAKPTDVVVSGGTQVTLTASDGTQKTLETGDGTLNGLVAALNGSGTGVSAAKVKLDDGSYRVLVTSTSTGAASAITLTNADGTDLLGGATSTAGRDAEIVLGGDTIHSSSNTFSEVVPGVAVTVSSAAVGTTVDVAVARDGNAIRSQVKAMVDAVNDVLSKIDAQTAYDTTAKTSGPLAGDASIRSLRNALLQSVYPAGNGTMADVGIQTDRYGKLIFDEATFDTAYAADPSRVAAKFTDASGTGSTTGSSTGTTTAADGFAARLAAVADGASNKYTGTITSSITGRNDKIDRLTDSIADWDTRLELRQASLKRQYAALETAMNTLTSQSSWLTSQIDALSSSSSS